MSLPFERCLCSVIFGFCFFFNDTATTEISTLSLHDALPICRTWASPLGGGERSCYNFPYFIKAARLRRAAQEGGCGPVGGGPSLRPYSSPSGQANHRLPGRPAYGTPPPANRPSGAL